jgi:hypothetical protein
MSSYKQLSPPRKGIRASREGRAPQFEILWPSERSVTVFNDLTGATLFTRTGHVLSYFAYQRFPVLSTAWWKMVSCSLWPSLPLYKRHPENNIQQPASNARHNPIVANRTKTTTDTWNLHEFISDETDWVGTPGNLSYHGYHHYFGYLDWRCVIS